MKKILPSLFGLLCAVFLWLGFADPTLAVDGTPAWTNYYNGADNLGGEGLSVAVDGGGNVIMTGVSVIIGGIEEYTTIKYSEAGVPLWTNIFRGGSNFDVAKFVVVDGSGNVIVTGDSTGRGTGIDFGTIKYSSAGMPLWTNFFNGAGNNNNAAKALALDGSGNVIVAGVWNDDYATIKYSSAGVPLWTNFFNGAGNGYDRVEAVAVDGNSNVFVTGFSMAANGHYDYATIKYSGAGTPLWTNRFNDTGNNDAVGLALVVDGGGNVIVTGDSTAANGHYDYATVKYSGAGVPLWTNLFNGAGNNDDAVLSLAADSSGNVFVTGFSMAANGHYDYATIKYSGAGISLWTNLFNGAGNGDDIAASVAVDGGGNVIVTGNSTGSGSVGQIATIKYSSAGVPLWTNLFNGTVIEFDGFKIAVDGSGNVFVTGASGSDFVTIKYSGPPPLTFITTNGSFGFSSKSFFLLLSGPVSSNAVIFASTNLQAWVPLFTNKLTGGTLGFTDTLATNYVRRFYRAALQ